MFKLGPVLSPVKALEAATIVLCPKALPLLAVDHKSSSSYLSGMLRSAFLCLQSWAAKHRIFCCCTHPLLDCSLVSATDGSNKQTSHSHEY